MDRILSARVDESIVQQIGVLAEELRISKKAVIENAICLYADKVECDKSVDPLDRTFGAWKRRETPETIVRSSRKVFAESMERHRR